jgi:multiple sugar transport system ATP-binding protein
VRLAKKGIPVTVVVTEPTGSETQVIVRLDEMDLTLMFHERIDVRPGETLHLAIDDSAVHLFEREGGMRL